MPSGAVSPAEPVTGPVVAKAQPRPDRRRLSSGLSAAYPSDGRRRKKETAGLRFCSHTKSVVTASIYQPLQFRPFGPGRSGLVSGGNRASGTARVRAERGTMAQNLLTTVNALSVVTNSTVRGPRKWEVLQILSGADVYGRCKRRPYLFTQSVGMKTPLSFMNISSDVSQEYLAGSEDSHCGYSAMINCG
jgi:hypothetical protein